MSTKANFQKAINLESEITALLNKINRKVDRVVSDDIILDRDIDFLKDIRDKLENLY